MNVIVAFPKIENARSIRSILMKGGYTVPVVCTTGAQVLSNAQGLGSGIVVCSARFADMMYEELRGYLPETFEMLLVASPSVCNEREIADIVCLSMPLQVHELLQTMEMMSYSLSRKKKKLREKPKERTKEQDEIIKNAKAILMERNNLSEEEAHRYIQKNSMDSGNDLVETAQMILSLMGSA